jgi:hypothetical protein
MYAVIELVDQDILSARKRDTHAQALDLALRCARGNGAESPGPVRRQLEGDGFWDQGTYRLHLAELTD